MRQPIWAINSSLLICFLFAQVVFFLWYTPIPRRTSLDVDPVQSVEHKKTVVVSLKNIYQDNDLFGTYIAPMISTMPAPAPNAIPVMPEAPTNIPLKIPVEPAKIFIAPLAVDLKGVIFCYDRPEKSIAIIQFTDSKEEMNYRVGQLINDAQILKIYPNRVIVVRSNGQQETLFLREDEASSALAKEKTQEVVGLNITLKDGIFHIPVDQFMAQIKSLGQFIDLLDLTTVYQKGKSVGCRIGKDGKDSLAIKLGLMKDDVVQQVDSLPVTDIASRILVFDHLMQKKLGEVISMRVERAGKTMELRYATTVTAQAATGAAHSAVATPAKGGSAKAPKAATQTTEEIEERYDLQEQRKKTLQQKVKLAPTAHQLEMQERRKMLESKRRDMLAQPLSGPGLAATEVQQIVPNNNVLQPMSEA